MNSLQHLLWLKVILFIFTSIHIFSNEIVAQGTIIIPAVSSTFGTGTVGNPSPYNKYSGELRLSTSTITNYGRGWMKFDLSVLPPNILISSVSVFYFKPTSGTGRNTFIKGYSTTSGASNDPAIATGSTLYNLCNASISPWVTSPNSNGMHTENLGATGINHMQSNYSANPLFVLTFATNANSNFGVDAYAIAGFNHSSPPNQPYLIINYGIPLPVSLAHFSAHGVKDLIKLEWTTYSEINNDYYSVMRSEDGKYFNKIGEVRGAGNTNQISNYDFNDMDPLRGISFYKLVQTDYDGKFSESHIVSVRYNPDLRSAFQVYPNPFRNKFSITGWFDSKTQFRIMTVDMKEKAIINNFNNQNDGYATIQCQYESLAPGVYFLVASNQLEIQRITLIKE